MGLLSLNKQCAVSSGDVREQASAVAATALQHPPPYFMKTGALLRHSQV
jgi:hypothetical protein